MPVCVDRRTCPLATVIAIGVGSDFKLRSQRLSLTPKKFPEQAESANAGALIACMVELDNGGAIGKGVILFLKLFGIFSTILTPPSAPRHQVFIWRHGLARPPL